MRQWYWGPGLSVVWLVLFVGSWLLGGRSSLLVVWVIWAVASAARAGQFWLRERLRREEDAEGAARGAVKARLQRERAELERKIGEASSAGASGSTRLAGLVRQRDEIDHRLREFEHG